MIIISADDARAAAGGESALPHATRKRGAARTGEEIKKLVRASAELVKTEGAGISIWYWNISATRWLSK